MQTRHVLNLLAVLISIGLAGGIGCSTSSRPPADGGSDGDEDAAGGDGTGDQDPNCLATGAACQVAADCCSARCEEGICLGPTGLCFELGHDCVASSECCSGRCEANPAGQSVCVLGGGCSSLGAPCATAVECCSLACVDGSCSDQASCAMVGQDCTADVDCCSNDCGDQSTCESSGAGCAPLGELCAGGDSSCCSGKCVQIEEAWRCVQVNVCRGEGDVCSRDSDCCSGVCGDDGLCPFLDECQTAGEPCTGFHECCSGICSDPGTGTPVCMFVSGCRSVGELCLEDGQCCGNICQAVGDTGLRRCIKPVNPGCLSSGEVCGGFNQGTSYNCCPPGAGGGAELCLETVLGVTRCYGEGTPDACLPDGDPCAFADECCSGFCLPDADTGTFACGTQCVELEGACTTHADCCGDAVCQDGVCEPNPFGCTPIGGECEQADACCSEQCHQGYCVET